MKHIEALRELLVITGGWPDQLAAKYQAALLAAIEALEAVPDLTDTVIDLIEQLEEAEGWRDAATKADVEIAALKQTCSELADDLLAERNQTRANEDYAYHQGYEAGRDQYR